MGRLRSKSGKRLGFFYFGLFLLAALHGIVVIVFNTAHSEFAGIFAIIVTLPWSLMFASLEQSLGVVDWYGKFAGIPWLYGCLGMAMLLPGALLNAAILYFIGRLFDEAPKT